MPIIKTNHCVYCFDVKTDQRNFMTNKLWSLAHFIYLESISKMFLWKATCKITPKDCDTLAFQLLYLPSHKYGLDLWLASKQIEHSRNTGKQPFHDEVTRLLALPLALTCSAPHTHLLWNKPCSWCELHYGQVHVADTGASCQQPEKPCGWEVSVTGPGGWSYLSRDPHQWGFQIFRNLKISSKSIQLLEMLIIPIKWTLVKPRQGELNLNILLFSKQGLMRKMLPPANITTLIFVGRVSLTDMMTS